MNPKKTLELSLLLVVVPSSSDKLEASKIQSRASSAYAANYDAVFSKKDAKQELN